MITVKIRRVGNSNVISLPRALEQLGFREGVEVVLVPTRHQELILMPVEHLESYIDGLGQRVVEENGEALAAAERERHRTTSDDPHRA